MNYIDTIYENIKLKEGKGLLALILKEIYINGPLSNKDISKISLLPIPISSAIKKEFIKQGLVKQQNGSMITEKGINLVENQLGFKYIDKTLYLDLMENPFEYNEKIEGLKKELEEIYKNRPSADVTIDQSKATLDTVINRGLLALSSNTLIGKNIACVGDDDLVSIILGFLLKILFTKENKMTQITVFDIDDRIIEYIESVAKEHDLNIICFKKDFRTSFDSDFKNHFDTVFTDTPYTETGLNLFVSRAVELLKEELDLSLFLSFANKSSRERFILQEYFYNMGLLIKDIIPNFNVYEGANILNNRGQMIVLNTTDFSKSLVSNEFKYPIYTEEFKPKKTKYICKQCKKIISLSKDNDINTIEKLKKLGCSCGSKTFNLYKQTSEGDGSHE